MPKFTSTAGEPSRSSAGACIFPPNDGIQSIHGYQDVWRWMTPAFSRLSMALAEHFGGLPTATRSNACISLLDIPLQRCSTPSDIAADLALVPCSIRPRRVNPLVIASRSPHVAALKFRDIWDVWLRQNRLDAEVDSDVVAKKLDDCAPPCPGESRTETDLHFARGWIQRIKKCPAREKRAGRVAKRAHFQNSPFDREDRSTIPCL